MARRDLSSKLIGVGTLTGSRVVFWSDPKGFRVFWRTLRSGLLLFLSSFVVILLSCCDDSDSLSSGLDL